MKLAVSLILAGLLAGCGAPIEVQRDLAPVEVAKAERKARQDARDKKTAPVKQWQCIMPERPDKKRNQGG